MCYFLKCSSLCSPVEFVCNGNMDSLWSYLIVMKKHQHISVRVHPKLINGSHHLFTCPRLIIAVFVSLSNNLYLLLLLFISVNSMAMLLGDILDMAVQLSYKTEYMIGTCNHSDFFCCPISKLCSVFFSKLYLLVSIVKDVPL